MCYSAQIWADYHRYVRKFGATVDIAEFARLYEQRNRGGKIRTPRAMDAAFAKAGAPETPAISQLIASWNERQEAELQQELFRQKKRVADAQHALQVRVTRKAQEDVRIGGNKVAQLAARLKDLQRSRPVPEDSRIFPQMHAPVLVSDGGRLVVRPMRYQCRPAGKPASYDRRYPGTYNARRDNLEGFWRGQFGHSHGLMVAETFYENVRGDDGINRVLQFTPRTGEPMYVACLVSRWSDPRGQEPDLWSFAAITDEPEPEVAAVGHDRTIINLREQHIGAWLNPEPGNFAALYAIFDDRQHLYYEHQEAA